MPDKDGSEQTTSPVDFFLHALGRCLRWTDHNIFFFVTLFFVLGIISAHARPLLFSAPLVLSAALLLALSSFLVYLRANTSSSFSLLLILPLFFLLGYLALQQQSKRPQVHGHIASLIKERQPVTLVGTLITMVEKHRYQQDGKEVIISRFEIAVKELLFHRNGADWQPVHGRVLLSMQGRNDTLQAGMSLIIQAKVGPVTSFQTAGVFDYREYLAAKNIFLSGRVIGDKITVLKEPAQKAFPAMIRSLCFLPEQVRQRISYFLADNLPASIAGTYQALLIGSRAGLSEEIQEQFKATGTMHLLAISGLHIGLLALMVGTIIGWLLKRSEQLLLHTHVPTLTLFATLPILFGYSFIAGMNTPVLRALIMTIILFSAFILRRQHSLPHLLAAAALLILVRNPSTLFTASFQLSFSAVTSIILFLPKILPSFTTDRAEKKARAKEQNWLIRLWQGFLIPALLLSLAATAGTLPFMLVHFHRFSLIGPIMNLLVEPFLCFWALPWGLAALPCLVLAPDLAVILLKIGGLGIQAGQWCTVIGAALPWASVWTITPTIFETIFYGLLMLLWVLSANMERFRKITRSGIIIGGLLLGLHFTWGLFFTKTSALSRVSYLDVGQGTSSLLEPADGHRILIDGGGNKNSRVNIGERIIAPYLWRQRIWRLDQAVITHPHRDHFNGMDFILARFRPKQLFINGDSRIEGNYQEIIDLARDLGTAIILPEDGEKIVQQGDTDLTVVSGAVQATQKGHGSVNDASLVLRYRHGNSSFFFPGDIEKKKEAVLLAQAYDLTADVLLAPHHGSSTSSSPAFLDAVAPSLIIVSAGKSGKKYFPASKNLAAWKKRDTPVVVTRNQGTIRCDTDGEQLRCLDFAGRPVYAR